MNVRAREGGPYVEGHPNTLPYAPAPPGSTKHASGDSQESSGRSAYEIVAQTVGFIPSLRGPDQIAQLICVLAFILIGTIAGVVVVAYTRFQGGALWGGIIGSLAGLILGTFLSGLVLMVLGWIRVFRRP